MGLDLLLPQVIALASGVGGTIIGLLSNRRKRVIDELGKLIDLRKECEPESPELQSIDNAVQAASRRLNRLSTSSGSNAILAVLFFMTAVMATIMSLVWEWAIDEDHTGVWVFASVYLVAAAIPMGAVAWISGKEFKRRLQL